MNKNNHRVNDNFKSQNATYILAQLSNRTTSIATAFRHVFSSSLSTLTNLHHELHSN